MAKEIILDIKPKESKLKKYLPIVTVAVVVTCILFAAGYGLGRYTEFEVPLFGEKGATKSATRKGWCVFETRDFSIEYPKNWEVSKNSDTEPIGAKVEGDGARVQFWLTDVREYRFSKEQREKQTKVRKTKLDVDGREADVTSYSYKDGDFFIVVEAASSEKRPKEIFWLLASDTKFKETSMEIVSTFVSKSSVQKTDKTSNE
ncbi:MAG TPA: hypothetical protein VF303_02790 [Candidatus Nanoarchaeia archaeon]